ncbi:hypothetical protein V8G61_01715 [Gaetbulibacter sp. M240]|uniref:hypothetical protein n=1 Tax=Gaetbulibacter sp. M240 TaxID=3126511 RepID=UPI00374E73F3
MKLQKTITTLSLFLMLLFLLPLESVAQKKQGPPSWAPAHGYRAKVHQIYFPDHNMYYDLQKGVYIYLNRDNWQISVNLPSIFGRIDLNNSPKVELELDTDSPQRYNAQHILKYKGRGNSKAKAKGPKNK